MKILYRTEDDADYESINAAKIHEALVSTEVYLESYKLKKLAEALDKDYILVDKPKQAGPLVKKGE